MKTGGILALTDSLLATQFLLSAMGSCTLFLKIACIISVGCICVSKEPGTSTLEEYWESSLQVIAKPKVHVSIKCGEHFSFFFLKLHCVLTVRCRSKAAQSIRLSNANPVLLCPDV